MNKHLQLEDLQVYQLARVLSKEGWEIYSNLSIQDKRILGDQFIRAIDSFGANIAEGYGRYHYLDKIKFFYNARASLAEGRHWLEILFERKKLREELYEKFKKLAKDASVRHQNFITSLYKAKSNSVSTV